MTIAMVTPVSDEGEVDRILAERARRLARPHEATSAVTTGRLFVGFSSGGMRFAMELDAVRRVMRSPRVTTIPGAPRHLSLVTHVGGRIVSLLDLPALLHPGEGPRSVRQALLLESNRRLLGILADEVEGVRPIDEATLSAPVAERQNRARGGLLGTAADMTVVLDARALVAAGGVAS